MIDSILDITLENAQQYIIDESHRRPVLVDFWADWCAPCKALMPVLDKLAAEYQGQFLLAKINADEQHVLTQQFGVRSLPTVMLIKDGQPVGGFAEVKPESEIRALLEQYLPKPWQSAWLDAQQLMQTQQFSDALPLLKFAYVDSGQRADIAFDYCRCLLVEQNIEQAQAVLSNVKMVDQDANYKQLLAQVELAQNAEKSPELEALAAQLAAKPDDFGLVLNLALQYTQHKYTADALALLYSYLKQDLNAFDGALRKCFTDILTSLNKGDALAVEYQRKLYTLLY